eukprot:4191606-Pleurochrysis_carterae.AAC.1
MLPRLPTHSLLRAWTDIQLYLAILFKLYLALQTPMFCADILAYVPPSARLALLTALPAHMPRPSAPLQHTRTQRPFVATVPRRQPFARCDLRPHQVELQYKSWGFSDELGWAAAWLYDATKEAAYAADFELNMRRGEDR